MVLGEKHGTNYLPCTIKRIALGGIIMTVIMFTPTYACVGTSDGIASYRSMENYISQMNITVRQSRQSGVARATCPD